MKKVLVTGADGFIGSHLVELLVREGYDVKAFCLYNSIGSWGWLDKIDESVKKNFEVVLGDIRDPLSVKNAMRGCEQTFHLAALISIPYSYNSPESYIDTNIKGTLNVLQSARELNLEKIIHTSTSEIYGSAKFVPITEDHPVLGQSPYSASKIAADQLALSFYKSFKTPITILRPFNTYGPRQSTRAVIPTIISQIKSSAGNLRLGKLTPTRDFNFVSDTCLAFLEISKSENVLGQIFNACSNFEISIEKTAKLLAEIMGSRLNIVSDEKRIRPDESEVNRLFGDNSKLREVTNWQPQFGGIKGFKKGLEITVDWFTDKKNLAYYNFDKYLL